ncbi:MAG: S41 family peptidase [Bacteroidales bacterium]|nr:S41 family peptidase [Bacteroidales bacterium]MBN2750036.1 S41 family peptidase [Bacteroidales bacterium]
MMNALKRFPKAFIAILLLASLAFVGYSFSNKTAGVAKQLEIFFNLFREVQLFYVDDANPEKMVNTGINAMLSDLDPYTEFIPEENKEDFNFMTTGDYAGIGSVIRASVEYPLIAEVYEGTPSFKAGLRAGDKIVSVDGKQVKGLRVDKVSSMLQGTAGTSITIRFLRIGSPDTLSVSFKRERIHVPSVPFAGILQSGVGYIRLNSFTVDCSSEFEKAFKNLKQQGATGLIIDLRGNPGGLLIEAVKIVNLFVPKNEVVVFTRGKVKDLDATYKTQSQPLDVNIPIAVMVNRGSASASEIVAGALQDLDRAVVIGERTFGKGLVQTTRNLGYNAQLKITTSKYYIPSGRCIQAVNYAKRNEDGSVAHIPDSLIADFKTRGGRLVRDGGGITPDIALPDSVFSRIAIDLYVNNHIFDFATDFRSKNEAIAQPDSYTFSEANYKQFLAFLNERHYEYRNDTYLAIEELRKIAKDDNTLEYINAEIVKMEQSLADKSKNEIEKNRVEIINLIEEEIVSRYYYQRGKLMVRLKSDPVLQETISIVSNRAKLNGILKP